MNEPTISLEQHYNSALAALSIITTPKLETISNEAWDKIVANNIDHIRQILNSYDLSEYDLTPLTFVLDDVKSTPIPEILEQPLPVYAEEF